MKRFRDQLQSEGLVVKKVHNVCDYTQDTKADWRRPKPPTSDSALRERQHLHPKHTLQILKIRQCRRRLTQVQHHVPRLLRQTMATW
jgi:hypothetical protein